MTPRLSRLAFGVACCLIPLSAAAQQRTSTGPRPTVTAVRIAEPPVVDGRLDEAVWRNAARITEFIQQRPVEGAPATEATDVYVAYDSQTLYFGIHARYSDADLIRANRVDRDQTANDDTVTVSFDPFLDGQRGYSLSVNGYGVQGDALMIATGGGASTDTSWNVLFESAGMLVTDGWTAEMAIPIKSLRYPGRRDSEVHRWGFQVQREIQGKDETVTWAPLSSNVMGPIAQMGILDGMRGLSTQRNLEVLPTVTALQVDRVDAAGRLSSDDVREAGVNLKYGITSNLTLDVTFNPDFSQIESDRPQIEVNQRFPLLFAELRPFFLEGQEIFKVQGPYPYLHTRTIVDPQYGAKLTGKIGRTTVGMLVANDEAPGRVSDRDDPAFGQAAQIFAGRVRFDLYRESFAGVMVTTRDFLDRYSRLAVTDNNFRIGPSFLVVSTTSFSDNRDASGVRRRGRFFDAAAIKQGRHVNAVAAYHDITPDYRNDNGFILRVDQRRGFGNISYRWWPESWVTNWGPRLNYERLYDHTGVLQDEVRALTLNTLFARNITVTGSINRDMERFGGQNFDKTRVTASAKIDTSRRVSLSADMNRGDAIRFVDDPFLGRTTAYNATVTVRPVSRFQSELRLNTTRFMDVRFGTEVFDVKILYANTTYQLTERLLVRNILEHNTLNRTVGANVLVTYRVNAGTVFFAGYDDRYRKGDAIDPVEFPATSYQRTNRAVFAKVQYLFRR